MTTHDERVRAESKFRHRAFLLLLTLISILFLFLMAPFFGAIFWACVIGLLFYPLNCRFLSLWNNRPNAAAFSTLVLCLFIGIIPAMLVLYSLFQEAAAFYQRLEAGDIDPAQLMQSVYQAFPALPALMDQLGIDRDSLTSRFSDTAINTSRFIGQHAIEFGQGTIQWLLSFGIMLYVAFFMLRDGPQLVALLADAMPLKDDQQRLLFSKLSEVTRATIKGNLIVALIQGSLGGLIFWFLGIPGPLLWGVIMTVLSLIPVVGAFLIWGPVAIYLFSTGDWQQGLILTLYGAVVIGLADNILRPILVGRDTKMPDYIVLLSTLGGFALFGLNGFVIGPLIAALFIAFWGLTMSDRFPDNRSTEPEQSDTTSSYLAHEEAEG